MKTIPLTQGQVAKVSDEWYEKLNKDKWHAWYSPGKKSYYAVRNSPTLFGKRKMIWMHKVVASTPEGMETDHKDGDTLNDQSDNLRNCTHSQNMQNQGKHSNNTSGFKGVCWHKRNKIWRVKIKVNCKEIHLGDYPTPEEAARAYDEAAKKYHGEFARLNFPG